HHSVTDVYCIICGTNLGWTYIEASEETQKYKIGHFCLEMELLIFEYEYIKYKGYSSSLLFDYNKYIHIYKNKDNYNNYNNNNNIKHLNTSYSSSITMELQQLISNQQQKHIIDENNEEILILSDEDENIDIMEN